MKIMGLFLFITLFTGGVGTSKNDYTTLKDEVTEVHQETQILFRVAKIQQQMILELNARVETLEKERRKAE